MMVVVCEFENGHFGHFHTFCRVHLGCMQVEFKFASSYIQIWLDIDGAYHI